MAHDCTSLGILELFELLSTNDQNFLVILIACGFDKSTKFAFILDLISLGRLLQLVITTTRRRARRIRIFRRYFTELVYDNREVALEFVDYGVLIADRFFNTREYWQSQTEHIFP